MVVCNSSTDCDNNKFGERCNKSCGHCLGLEQCHHINGTCMNGCDSGYESELCTKGKTSYSNHSRKTLHFDFNFCESSYKGLSCSQLGNF